MTETPGPGFRVVGDGRISVSIADAGEQGECYQKSSGRSCRPPTGLRPASASWPAFHFVMDPAFRQLTEVRLPDEPLRQFDCCQVPPTFLSPANHSLEEFVESLDLSMLVCAFVHSIEERPSLNKLGSDRRDIARLQRRK